MRATFQHLAADLRPVRRLVALADLAAAGIVDRAACAAFLVRRPRHRIPVSCPFPDIADHVVEAVIVGWIAADGAGAVIAVGLLAREGQEPAPVIGHDPALGLQFVAPLIVAIVLPAPPRKFPPRLRRPPSTRPSPHTHSLPPPLL